MTIRTSSKTVTFVHPFRLSEADVVYAPGTYTVETDEELLHGLSFDAYRRVATTIRLPSASGDARLDRIVAIDPLELDAAQERDKGGG